MSFRVVIQTRHVVQLDEIAAESEQEARDIALAQSDCDGQRTWRFHVYEGDKRLASYRGGAEMRPKPPPKPVQPKSYSVSLYTATGVHVETLPMDSEAEAVEFALKKSWKFGCRTMRIHVFESFPGGQRHLVGRFLRGRRLKG